jgi:CoA:oxalate CoA-transferase
VRAYNERVIYVSLSGYGQSTSWRNRPAFAPTVQAETGFTSMVQDHFGTALSEPRGDACSHADVYTGLQGVVAVLAALQHRHRTGEGQHVDVSMAATMLSINERAGALLSGIDTESEPVALAAPESHIYQMADGTQLTIASSPIYSPMFMRYCAMMRRTDLLTDPRYASAQLRRQNLAALLAEVRAWLVTFGDFELLQAQVSEAGLAVGRVRTTEEFAESEWVKEWNAVVAVDDRAGGSVRMPGNPWIFSRSTLPPPGCPAFQGEHNEEILAERDIPKDQIDDMKRRRILLSRKTAVGAFD